MTCTLQADKLMFPGCSDVVRVNTPRWNESHNMILESLFDQVEQFLQTRRDRKFEDLLHEYIQNEPRAKVENCFVYLMYGPSGPFFVDDSGELKMDLRGLVFKPRVRRQRGKIIAEF